MLDNLTKFLFSLCCYRIRFAGSVEALDINGFNLLILLANISNTSHDTPARKQSMYGRVADEYREASCTEVETLEKTNV